MSGNLGFSFLWFKCFRWNLQFVKCQIWDLEVGVLAPLCVFSQLPPVVAPECNYCRFGQSQLFQHVQHPSKRLSLTFTRAVVTCRFHRPHETRKRSKLSCGIYIAQKCFWAILQRDIYSTEIFLSYPTTSDPLSSNWGWSHWPPQDVDLPRHLLCSRSMPLAQPSYSMPQKACFPAHRGCWGKDNTIVCYDCFKAVNPSPPC